MACLRCTKTDASAATRVPPGGGSAARTSDRRASLDPAASLRAGRPLAVVLPAMLLLAALAGCGGEPEPVAQLRVEPDSVRLPYPGRAELHLTWQPTAPLGEVRGQPRVFVHLLDEQGELVRTFDHPFPAGWQVGAPVTYPLELYQSALGVPLDAGRYQLVLGLYDEGGKRWRLTTRGDEGKREEYRMAEVEVPGVDPVGFPHLTFSDGWLPPDPGTDRQILGRRWLDGEGEIAVTGSGTAGRLRFSLSIPPGSDEVRMVLEPQAASPAVRVTSTCDGSETMVSGPGAHSFAVAVPAQGECTVDFDPNYRPAWPAGPERTFYLEKLFWDDAAGGEVSGPTPAAR